MAKKIFKYRGKTLEELKELSHDQLADLFPAQQRRKLKRGLSEKEAKLLKRLSSKDTIKTHMRDMLVLPEMVGKTLKIHNGQKYEAVTIQNEAIGCRLGELVLTRKRLTHGSAGVGATRSSAKVSVR